MNMRDSAKTPLGSIDEAEDVLERSGTNPHREFLLSLAVFAAVGLLLMLLAPEAPLSIRLMIIALVYLTLKRWGGVVVLLLVQADLYSRESQWASALSGFWGLAFVLLVLMVLMFVARLRLSLQQTASGSVFRLARELLQSSELPRSASDISSTAPVVPRMLLSALHGMTILFFCVMTARILLGILPKNRQLNEKLRDVINADPALTMGAILIVSIVALWVVASEISWRQMTAAQARLYLRSNFLKIHYRDLRMIVVRRLKQRLKRLAERTSDRKNVETASR